MNRILILFLFLIPSFLFSQNFKATVTKNNVSVGEEFQLIFTASGKSSDFRAPNLNGLRKLSGPNKSSSSSMQIINGKVSSSESTSYSYYLTAIAEGELTIAPAFIVIDGKKVASKAIKLKVSKADPNANKGLNIEEKVELKVSINKSKVYQGEQIVITYKLYSEINLAEITILEIPEMNGFWKEDVKTNSKGKIEVINGVNYKVWEISKSIITPQKSGVLEIDPMLLDIKVQVPKERNRRDPFGMFNNYRTIMDEVSSRKIKINVKDLPPNAPKEFNGAVGSFKLKASIDKVNAKTNEAINYKLVLSGKGNIHLIDEIAVDFPSDFETYDVQKQDKTFVSKNGISGKIILDYLFIPRFQGEYTIPATKFAYFDPAAKKYKTVDTENFTLNITKGKSNEGSFSSSDDLKKEVNSKLNEIETNTIFEAKNSKKLNENWTMMLLMILPILLLLFYLIKEKYYQILDANPIDRKFRKSLRIAQKRLKKAEKLMKNAEKEQFFEEIEKSLWHYFSSKFNVDVADLSKETISVYFEKNSIKESVSLTFIEIIKDCEFCRFAPSSLDNSQMDTVYEKATKVIIEVEHQLKK